MIISGAWALKQLPCHYVISVPGHGLLLARISPFREVTMEELTPYYDAHPRQIHGVPMPDYLYRFYGFEKSGETASEVLHVRVTPSEKEDVSKQARDNGVGVSDYIRRAIKNLGES